jgi:hypothetical protein
MHLKFRFRARDRAAPIGRIADNAAESNRDFAP